VQFLVEHGFCPPPKLLQPAIVNRFKYFGVADEVMNQQRALLESLLSGRRFNQLMDEEVLGDQAYSALDFLTDVQNGIWSELKAKPPQIDVCRRHLQRAYLDYLKKELSAKEAEAARPAGPRNSEATRVFSATTRDTDFRAVARAALGGLADRLDTAVGQARDPMTKVHLQDCRREVDLILNPKS
jgi:hypothetical protein